MRSKLILTSVLMMSASSAALAWDSAAVSPAQANNVNVQAQQQVAAPAFGAPAEDSWGGIPTLPLEVMQAGDVRFINGGVSDEELAQLKETNGDYNLHLLISGVGGEYVGDVTVRIYSGSTPVVAVADAGPYLYVALKPGNYNVVATSGGKDQKFKVSVPAKGSLKKNISVAN
ncbi:MAG: carboxypeptidase regulatory-like domain-containing protein [Alphaproteobacteria bacterium]|nr:carboxypeptidase regulatory-like domain-containing protein [Alphaproteobacteria bacterium]